jgi:hypothetical protein
MVAIAWVAIELFSYAAYLFATGEFFSFGGVRQSQRDIASLQSAAPGDPKPRTKLEHLMAADAIHPYLGFVYDPDEWNVKRRSRKLHGLPVSDFGFVDDKSPIQEASADRVVVGIFGGSVALQLSLKAEEVLLDELRKIPRFGGDREFVVVRTALGSHKQPQQGLILDYLLSLGGHFDLVINLDGFNEVALAAESQRKGVYPFYPRGWSLRMAGVPETELLKLIGAKFIAEQSRSRWAATFLEPPLRYSVTSNLVWKLRDRQLAGRVAEFALGIQQFETQAKRAPFQARGPAFAAATEADLYREIARVWARSSLQMSRLVGANGGAYFHFLQPNQYVPKSKIIGPKERAIAIDRQHPYRHGVRAGYPHLVDAGQSLPREGVEFHDLSRIFKGVERPLYSDACCHLNEEGIGLLATRIGEIIRSAFIDDVAQADR